MGKFDFKMDHDLLVKVSTIMDVVKADIANLAKSVSLIDTRLRNVEDAITKLSPIPSISHADLVNEVKVLNSKIDCLDLQREQFRGGFTGLKYAGIITLNTITLIVLLLHLFGIVKGA